MQLTSIAKTNELTYDYYERVRYEDRKSPSKCDVFNVKPLNAYSSHCILKVNFT
jgi:hypothetical protein